MATQTSAQNKQRIMIIDDEATITDLIAEISSNAGFEVITVTNTEEISARYNDFAPHCVFLDLDLGNRDGVEVLQYLSIAECKSKIFIMSGMDSETRESTRQIGLQMSLNIVGILSKPFSVADVQKLLALL